tara:strand:+ start:1056 stop:1907 length:852 start_codon:yes stop_codon:yes gene_type:complete
MCFGVDYLPCQKFFCLPTKYLIVQEVSFINLLPQLNYMKLKLYNGEFINLSVHGLKNKNPVIYCVGFGESQDDLLNKHFIEQLSSSFFVITFDYRNTGKSSGNIENLKTSDMIADLKKVLKYCKVKFSSKNWGKTTIIGWSHGSIVSLIFSTKQKIKNLILIGYDGFIEKESDFSRAWKKLRLLPDISNLKKGKLVANKRLPLKYQYHLDLKKYKKNRIIPKSKAEHILILQGSKDDFAKTKEDFSLLKQRYEIIKIKKIGHELNISKVYPQIKKFITESLEL